MGLLGNPLVSDTEVEKATDANNSKEQWDLILNICDKAGKSQDAKEYLQAIIKRISNPDPHISLQAITLLDACVKNSGRAFQEEVASRFFEKEYKRLLKSSQKVVITKLKEALKRWAETEFKTDKQLSLIPSMYEQLKREGIDFSAQDPPKATVVLSKDPNVVQSQDEEDQIAKAIELSLKETSGSPRNTATTSASLYPSTNIGAATMSAPPKEERKVRAMYDFEAAEDNELTFGSGELILVIDDSDPNWWKGRNQRGEGLFPANFVTTDLSLDPDQLTQEKKNKLQELDDHMNKKLEEMHEPEIIEIDEGKIDRLLHILHEVDPTTEEDTKEMLQLEREVNAMGALIDKELERVDRKHAQLTQVSTDLVESFNFYHTLMREQHFIPVNKPLGYPPQTDPQSSLMFNGTLPHHPHASMGPPSMMYNTMGHDRPAFMPSHVPNMTPNQFSLPPQGIAPPGHMAPPGASGPPHIPMQPPMSAPPPQSLPPHMGLPLPPMHGNVPPPHVDNPRLPGPPFHQHQGFPAGFPNLQPPASLISGQPPTQNGYSLPPANTHIM